MLFRSSWSSNRRLASGRESATWMNFSMNLDWLGFRIGQANNANAGVTVDVKEFNAKVEQGNLRYTLNSKIQAVVYVQGQRGQYNKTFNATRSQSGAFNASNDEIQKVLGETFKDIVNNIYQDQEVTNAINQYTN